ncbi:MAG: hypothetical protein ND866_21925 [Pyrinomonadaceae bacterium]|nr:hypothetical protein [Pyrinomonadaceae bacterium]
MVFVTDEGQKIWVVVNPKALKGLEGKHVTVTGELNAASKKIRVITATEVKTGASIPGFHQRFRSGTS